MDGLFRAIGDSVSGFWNNAFGSVGAAFDGVVASLQRAIPGGIAAIVGFLVVTFIVWRLIAR